MAGDAESNGVFSAISTWCPGDWWIPGAGRCEVYAIAFHEQFVKLATGSRTSMKVMQGIAMPLIAVGIT